MKAGETLFIPSGWIHAVYSPMDCINFGGNFLHGLSMAMQVKSKKIKKLQNFSFDFSSSIFV